MSIPKLIHWIWIQGEENMNADDRMNINNIRNLNPDWQSKVWNEESIQQLLSLYPKIQDKYNNVHTLKSNGINPLASKSDIARWVIVKHYGGCYMDVDVTCISNLNYLINKIGNKTFAVSIDRGMTQYSSYSSQFFMSTQNNFIWDEVFDEIIKSYTQGMLGASMSRCLKKYHDYIYIFKRDEVSMYHCGIASGCMIPIKTESTFNLLRLYSYNRCKFIGLYDIFLHIIIIIILLYLYKLYRK